MSLDIFKNILEFFLSQILECFRAFEKSSTSVPFKVLRVFSRVTFQAKAKKDSTSKDLARLQSQPRRQAIELCQLDLQLPSWQGPRTNIGSQINLLKECNTHSVVRLLDAQNCGSAGCSASPPGAHTSLSNIPVTCKTLLRP